jgi:hypothetical protein
MIGRQVRRLNVSPWSSTTGVPAPSSSYASLVAVSVAVAIDASSVVGLVTMLP